MREPGWIQLSDLRVLLATEVAKLVGDDLTWWLAHRIEPRVVPLGGRAYFVVAQSGDHLLVFFDDEDEFGVLAPRPDNTKNDYGLYGDLIDAVRGLRAHSSNE